METYILKNHMQSTDYMTIESELEEGYMVKIIRDKDGYEDITTDFISRELFDSCVRTGYIAKCEEKAISAITA